MWQQQKLSHGIGCLELFFLIDRLECNYLFHIKSNYSKRVYYFDYTYVFCLAVPMILLTFRVAIFHI